MPTVLANAILSFVPDRSISVRGPDRVGVVSPMFNEAAGAHAALGSLLAQTEPFDELVVSINGGTDDTLGVVRAVLEQHDFTKVYAAPAPDFGGNIERWHRPHGPAVVLLQHDQPISKADSINTAVGGNYLSAERVLVVDGDTIFAPTFLQNLKDDFYRLRRRKNGRDWQYELEDNAIQSGAVTSLAPGRGQPMGSHISRARAAEYAVATLLRSGQTARIGRGVLFGQSRLYTVVGCGFVARRGSFPMPSDTMTEDHDFTLQVQNEEVTERPISRAELQERGFRVVTAHGEVAPADYFLPEDQIVLRRGGTARFVPGALMYTEDPLNLPGYMRQVERWNGGGLENTVKRVRRPARSQQKPNVAFATLAAQFENLFGLALLLLILPVALGVNSALPGYGTALTGLAAWLGFDLLATLLLVGLGFRRLWRAQGQRGWQLAWGTAASTLRSSVPLLTLRLFNAVAYVVALTRVVPGALRAKEIDPSVTITWERPRAVAKRQLGVRATTVVLSVLLGNVSLFAGSYYLADTARPGYRDTWQMINATPPINTAEHVALPLLTFVSLVEPAPNPLDGSSLAALKELGASDPPPPPDEELALVVATAPALSDPPAAHLSAYCSVGFTHAPAKQRLLLAGDADAYQPLTYWQRLVLARLVPLAANLEEAATAYDVSPELLLRVLINESYLDPLAVGPTNDLGLSQVTGDALTLLREISNRPESAFANTRLFGGPFNVFDPDFSICAGAAKLAWASAQPGGDDERYAYARYINPLEGVQRSGLNPVHAELVVALEELVPLADALRNAFAAYRSDQQGVSEQERSLFSVYDLVVDGQLSQRAAYLAVQSLVRSFGIDDGDFYDNITDRLYGETSNTVSLPPGF